MEMTMIGQWKGVAETVQNNWKCRAAGCKDKMEGPQMLKHNKSMQKSNNGRHTAVKIVDWYQEVVPEGCWQVKWSKTQASNKQWQWMHSSGGSQKLLQSQKQLHTANKDDSMQIVNNAILAQRKHVVALEKHLDGLNDEYWMISNQDGWQNKPRQQDRQDTELN